MIFQVRRGPAFLVGFLLLLQETASAIDVADPPAHAQQLGPWPYSFAWQVKDAVSALDYAHQEYRNGKTVAGFYRTLLPDNRVQIVSYKADENGYTASVRYEKPRTSPVKAAVGPQGVGASAIWDEFTTAVPTTVRPGQAPVKVPPVEKLTLEELIRLNPGVPVYYPEMTHPAATRTQTNETPRDALSLVYRTAKSPYEKQNSTRFPKLNYGNIKRPRTWRQGSRLVEDLLQSKVTVMKSGCSADSVRLPEQYVGKPLDEANGIPVTGGTRRLQRPVYFPQRVQLLGEKYSSGASDLERFTNSRPPNSAGTFNNQETEKPDTYRALVPITESIKQHNLTTPPSYVRLPAEDRVPERIQTPNLAAHDTESSDCQQSNGASCFKHSVSEQLRELLSRRSYSRLRYTPSKTTRYARLTEASRFVPLEALTKTKLSDEASPVVIPKRLSYPERNKLLYQLKRVKSVVVPAYVPSGQNQTKTNWAKNKRTNVKVQTRFLTGDLVQPVHETAETKLPEHKLQKTYSKVTRYSARSELKSQF